MIVMAAIMLAREQTAVTRPRDTARAVTVVRQECE